MSDTAVENIWSVKELSYMKSHLIMSKIESRDLLRKRTFIEENMSENVKYLCGYFLKMSSNFNSSYMAISSLTYNPVFFV